MTLAVAAIPKDKLQHFGAGAVIAGFGAAVMVLLTGDTALGLALGFALGAGAGLLKELYDAKHGGHVELKDYLATAAGSGAGVLTFLAVMAV